MRPMPDRRDIHLYLPDRERQELIAWAESESRSISNLVMYVVRQALAARDASTAGTDRRHPVTKGQRS